MCKAQQDIIRDYFEQLIGIAFEIWESSAQSEIDHLAQFHCPEETRSCLDRLMVTTSLPDSESPMALDCLSKKRLLHLPLTNSELLFFQESMVHLTEIKF
jgi:hypothetical protein